MKDITKQRSTKFSARHILPVLCAAAVFCLFAACGRVSRSAAQIDNIALLNEGYSFEALPGAPEVRYGRSGTAVSVPLTVTAENQDGFAGYVSGPVTAVAFEGDSGDSPIEVLVSRDKGKHWSRNTVAETDGQYAGEKFVGFTTENDGWLVTDGGPAAGMEMNRIFVTSDGGESWAEIGNTSQVYPHVLTGAGFADGKTGLLSFRPDEDAGPVVYRTENAGKTWTRCQLEIPESWRKKVVYATARSPVFSGPNGVLPVDLHCRDNTEGENPDPQIRYVTSDSGKTWTYDKTGDVHKAV